jgi:4-amino-4-deoxy-L-arabinose transferase-like glycosyltransferase
MSGVARALVLVALAATLRLATVDAHMFWWDEWLTVTNARGLHSESLPAYLAADAVPQLNTLDRIRLSNLQSDGGNSILHYVLLHYWSLRFGSSELAARFPSVLAGVATVIVLWRLGITLVGPQPAFVSALLAAGSPLLIRYSQEARGYSLATLLATGAIYAYVQFRSGGRRLWVPVHGAALGLALLSHFLVVGLAVALWLDALLSRERQRVLRLMTAHALAGVLVAIWLVGLDGSEGLRRMQERNSSYRLRASQSAAHETFVLPPTAGNMARGWVQMTSHMAGVPFQLFGVRLGVGWPLLLAPVVLTAFGLRRSERADARLTLLLAASAPAFASFLALRSGHTIAFQQLYAVWATPFVCLLIGTGLASLATSRRSSRLAWLVGAAYVTLMTLGVAATLADWPWRRPRNPYPDATRLLCASARAEEDIVLPDAVEASRYLLYLPIDCRARFYLGGRRP